MELGKIINYKKGKAPTGIKLNEELVTYLTPEYLRNKSKEIFIPDFIGKVEVNKDDLLLLWDGSNAGEFFLGKKGILSSTMVKLIFDEKENDKIFLFYQLKFIEYFLKSQTNGSGIPHVDKEVLLSINVEYFSSSEQQSIANILSKTDQAIAHTEALITKYTRIKTGLMQDLLTKGIDKNGKIRSEQTHEFKDSPLGRIPKEWECYLFKEIIQNFDSGWSPNCEAQPASINEWGSLKTTSITWDGYNSDENKRLPLNLNPNPKLEVQFDDILITRVGPRERVGVVVHVNDYREKLMISDNMLRLKIIPSSKIFLPFLPLMLGSTSIQKDFKNKIAGLAEAQVVINQQSIKSTFIFMPSKNEQEQIYFRHKKMNELIISENKKLSKLQSLKTGLMQDLLSGKVRVNNLKLKEANETALA
jgi:type I restriction enzyme S subunit